MTEKVDRAVKSGKPVIYLDSGLPLVVYSEQVNADGMHIYASYPFERWPDPWYSSECTVACWHVKQKSIWRLFKQWILKYWYK